MIIISSENQFALDPTPVQERAIRSHAGAARNAHNMGSAG